MSCTASTSAGKPPAYTISFVFSRRSCTAGDICGSEHVNFIVVFWRVERFRTYRSDEGLKANCIMMHNVLISQRDGSSRMKESN